MSKQHVNLDALIRREDFEIRNDQPSSAAKTGGDIKLSELESNSIIFQMLRKPDFQRETANWTPEKITQLIRGFVDGDLIPSIIMWRSPESGNIFVIDGAHRLSAFIAWVHDDYGDRLISAPFFDHSIPKAQKKAAEETRDLIRKTIGSYEDLKFVAKTPQNADATKAMRAKNAGVLAIELQWVTGNASKAEASFFTINQSATAIHPAELRIIKARRKPNAVAARAIMRAGTGHKYWSGFDTSTQTEIEKNSKEIYDLLFNPDLHMPIKTLDLPVAGEGYSADSLSIIFDLVNYVNELKDDMWLESSNTRKRKSSVQAEVKLVDDSEGKATLECLHAVKKVASRISGDYARSIGLHPAVYFYGATGRFQPPALLATVRLIKEMEQRDAFANFTKHRNQFEEFLVKYKHFRNQIVGDYGGGARGVEPFLDMYRQILDGFVNGRPEKEIVDSLLEHPRLKRNIKLISETDRSTGRNFSVETKSAAYLRDALDGAPRCGICGARVHVRAISIDHVTPKRDGGIGDLSNAQLTHPYCNTGYKESLAAKPRYQQAEGAASV